MNGKNKKQGFSLIEVIVAVAILAILSMPILLYFTDSAVRSAKGRHEQAADVAAQSVVEEIDAVDGFDNLEQYFVNGSNGWEFVKDGDDNPLIASDSKGKTVLKKPVSIDYDGYGQKDFMARVEIDYGAYQASSESNKTAKYNDYNNPHLSEVYTDGSVIVSESDETESGIYSIYHQLNGHSADPTSNSGSDSVSLDEIKAGVKRDFIIKVNDDVDGYVFVSGGYRLSFTASGTTKKCDVEIKSSRVLKSELNKIYFLFRFMKNGTAAPESNVYLDVSSLTEEECKKLAISFIRQKTPVWGNPSADTHSTGEDTSGDGSTGTNPDDGSDGSTSDGSGTGDDTGDTSGDSTTDGTGDSGVTNPVTTTPDPAMEPITVSLNGEIKKENLLKLTLIGGGPDDSSHSGGHVGSVNFYANDNVYFSNAANKKANPDPESEDQGNLWMVNSPNDKRIAKVHIYIYSNDTYSDDLTEGFLAETITSKSI